MGDSFGHGKGFHVRHALEVFLEPSFEAAYRKLTEVFVVPEPGQGVELGLMLFSVAVAAAGIWVASRFYREPSGTPERLAARFPAVYRTLLEKYRVDELYQAVFVRGLALGGGNALFATDRWVVDGGDGEVRPGLGVNGVAWSVRDVIARASNFWDRWVVDGAVNLTAFVLDNLSYGPRPALRPEHADRPLPPHRRRPLPPGPVLGARTSWNSSGTTCSRSSPTRLSSARSCCSSPSSGGRAGRARSAGSPTPSASSASS